MAGQNNGHGRTEERHDLHHAGKGVDHKGAAESRYLAFAAEDHKGCNEGKGNNGSKGDMIIGIALLEYPVHQQEHGEAGQNDFRQACHGIIILQEIHQRAFIAAKRLKAPGPQPQRFEPSS